MTTMMATSKTMMMMIIDEEDCNMTTTMKLTDIGETPFVVILSYLDAREINTVQQVCKELRQNSALAWSNLEKTFQSLSPTLDHPLGEASTARERCCRFFKARNYAAQMESMALQHYDFSDPEPTHVKCWCCRQFPNLNTRVFRHPHKFEVFCRISSRLGDERAPVPIWEGFRPATKISYSGLSLDLSQFFRQIKVNETFDTSMFQSYERNFVTMCDVTDSLMVTVVAVEKAYPWKTTLLLSTGGFHDCLGSTNEDEGDNNNNFKTRTFRFHPRMVRSHGIVSDEDYITAGLQTSMQRLGDPLLDCRLVLEHQW